jgi:hypothetical protein
MKARMKMSLSSASFAMSERKQSMVTSRNSPGSATRPRAREPVPEIKTMSPEKFPGRCVANTCSPESLVMTILSAPESTKSKASPAHPRFATLRGVRAMIETYPLEKAAEAYARMISGEAKFRVVLTT